MSPTRVAAPLLALVLAACGSTPVPPQNGGHLGSGDVGKSTVGSIPAPVQATPTLSKPKAAPKTETYSVVVKDIRVQELLFALARDAKINVDIHPGIEGVVTLNAIDQTLQQLLTRIAKQVDMRWELDGPNLVVMPDTPFLRTYKVDYVNMARDVTSTIASSNSVSSGIAGSTGSNVAGAANQSTTKIDDKAQNHFWETLEKNLKDLLRETDKILPEGSSETVIERADQQASSGVTAGTSQTGAGRTAVTQPGGEAASKQTGTTVLKRSTFVEKASVIVNQEAGVVTVRATGRQHEKVQEYLSSVIASTRRQVLIEATIAEVSLNDAYSQGIDWSRLRADGSGFTITSPTSANVNAPSTFKITSANYKNPLSILFALDLLQSFGNVKVLSSPKVSVLNNQTAILRVVENYVYFKVDSSQNSSVNTGVQTSINTTPQTVQVGLTMAVTPQVGDNDAVILNVRPTITQISKLVQDPNPLLLIQNNVPQLRTREMESVMRVNSGDIAVLGGLMQDSIDYTTNRIPILGQIPLLGEVFTNRANTAAKTELVVFIRPIVVKDASIAGDFAGFKSMLPDKDFFPSGTARHGLVMPVEPAKGQ